MALSLTYTPAYPVSDTEITLDATDAVGTSREFELTSVPSQSALALGRLNDLSGNAIDTFTPDAPGEYGITVYDYRETGFAPARWRGDITAQGGKKVLSTIDGIVYVGEAVELPIVTLLGHGATLRLTIVGETARAAVLVDPLDELTRLVCLDAAVLAALDDLVDVDVSVLGNDLVTAVGDLVTNFETHRVDESFHAVPDDVNAMLRKYVLTTSSQAYAIAQLNEARDRLENHTRPGSGAPRWHGVDDTKNTFLVGAASDLASATVLMVDAGYRVYERHRVMPTTVHIVPDSDNTMSPALPLTTFILTFLDAIAVVDPSVVAGESEGAGDAAHRYGFKRSPTA